MTAVRTRRAVGGRAVVSAPDGEAAASRDRPRRPGPDEYDSTSLDAFFGLLKNERRRRVVRYLDEVSPTTTLSDLAEHIAAVENDKPKQALNAQERKRVYIQLYQYHLPAMDEAGVIAFDGDRGTVERTPEADRLTELLDADGVPPSTAPARTTADRELPGGDSRPPAGGGRPSGVAALDTWSVYYLGLGLVGAGLLGLRWSSPVAALVDGALVGVLLMAVVSCLLVRAASGPGNGYSSSDGAPASGTAGTERPAAVPDGTPVDGPSPRGTLEALLPPRLRRPEEPSSNGTAAGPVESG